MIGPGCGTYQSSAALRRSRVLVRWEGRVRALGFDGLEDYLADRRGAGASAHRVRVELGCGGSVAARLIAGALKLS